MTTATDPLTVELPVCPACENVSRVNVENYPGRSFCTGRKGERHRRIQMQARTFVEVREDEGGDN